LVCLHRVQFAVVAVRAVHLFFSKKNPLLRRAGFI
jgi:hypothetical protein